MIDSKKYWIERYLKGRNSGAGSYGKLAQYKANFINNFVANNKIKKVIEFGSGDGNQIGLFKFENYTGVDVSEQVINRCKLLYPHYEFYTPANIISQQADLTLSLDVIYHLIEDEVFNNYMSNLFSYSSKYVLIYSSNIEKITAAHVKQREFTKWIGANRKDFKLIKFEKNPYSYSGDELNTSISDFYIFEQFTSKSD